MKKTYIFLIIVLLCSISVSSQAIRKNFLEMTENEKVNLVNAFYQLRTGADLMNDLTNFHADFFNLDGTNDPTALDLHFNLPDEPERDVFLVWHRQMIFELEQAMQDINPSISMPYWDSSTEQSINSSLWDQNFLGQFDDDWNLNRNLGGTGSLPTPQEVINVQSNTDFLLYSNAMERGSPHNGAHRWVGGPMRTAFSPRDPVFYLHHTNVDRLWAEWENINQSSSYLQTTLIRYDGTYVFDGVTLPVVTPSDILDEKALGTFYAVNQLAQLEDYTVSNTYNPQEYFYYQYTIQAGNNFQVPSGRDCKFESVNEIVLQPGFEALSGSTFTAGIDNQVANRIPLSKRRSEIVRNQIPYDDVGEMEDVWINQIDGNDTQITVIKSFPNPFSNKITIQLNNRLERCKVFIIDMTGAKIKEEVYENTNKIEIVNFYGMPSGTYVLQVVDSNGKVLIAKRIIKM